jgi:hypothetical protein
LNIDRAVWIEPVTAVRNGITVLSLLLTLLSSQIAGKSRRRLSLGWKTPLLTCVQVIEILPDVIVVVDLSLPQLGKSGYRHVALMKEL